MNSTVKTLWAVSLVLSAGCQKGATTADEAAAAANAYLTNDMGFDLKSRSLETIDMGDRWRLSYISEPGSTGGPIIVVINKRSGKVVHMETEQ